MLKDSSLKLLKNQKNLLAFSAGVDSSALFFLLLQDDIKFDIAIVDYGLREQSKEEVKYAKELAIKYNSTCHTFNAKKLDKNFEAKARDIRYDFFEQLIKEYNYDNLITAHHLGDRFEWMLMQFCKGAGCAEMAGMQMMDKKEFYTLIRPLLHLDKSELLCFLNKNKIKYFQDETNFDETIKRNSFRHNITNPLLKKHLSGIKKSFNYIDEDRKELVQDTKIQTIGDFAYFKSSDNKRTDIFAIDKYLKTKLHMPSASERELLKTQKTVVLGRKFVVNQEHGYIFIAPYKNQNLYMPKVFKEECRVLKIEPKLRPYLYTNKNAFSKINELLRTI